MSDNKCAACGQWAGKGHRCPPPSAFITPSGQYQRIPTLGRENGPSIDTSERVARANAALATIAEDTPVNETIFANPPAPVIFDKPVMTNVSDLRPGDIIDLAGDTYANPDGDDSEYVSYEYEYALVDEVEQEDDGRVVAVYTDAGGTGFPAGHQVRKVGRDPGFDD